MGKWERGGRDGAPVSRLSTWERGAVGEMGCLEHVEAGRRGPGAAGGDPGQGCPRGGGVGAKALPGPRGRGDVQWFFPPDHPSWSRCARKGWCGVSKLLPWMQPVLATPLPWQVPGWST